MGLPDLPSHELPRVVTAISELPQPERETLACSDPRIGVLIEELRTNSSDPDRLIELGKKLIGQGKALEGGLALEDALILRPTSIDAMYELATAYRLQSTPDRYVELAERQIAIFERILKLEPTEYPAAFFLGIASSGIPQLNERTIAAYRLTIEIAPDSAPESVHARAYLAEALIRKGDIPSAKVVLEELFDLPPNRVAYLYGLSAAGRLADLYFRDGEYAKVINLLSPLLAKKALVESDLSTAISTADLLFLACKRSSQELPPIRSEAFALGDQTWIRDLPEPLAELREKSLLSPNPIILHYFNGNCVGTQTIPLQDGTSYGVKFLIYCERHNDGFLTIVQSPSANRVTFQFQHNDSVEAVKTIGSIIDELIKGDLEEAVALFENVGIKESHTFEVHTGIAAEIATVINDIPLAIFSDHGVGVVEALGGAEVASLSVFGQQETNIIVSRSPTGGYLVTTRRGTAVVEGNNDTPRFQLNSLAEVRVKVLELMSDRNI